MKLACTLVFIGRATTFIVVNDDGHVLSVTERPSWFESRPNQQLRWFSFQFWHLILQKTQNAHLGVIRLLFSENILHSQSK